MRTVLVDSNAIVQRDWFLLSASWRVLLFEAQDGLCRLVVPEIVIREATGRYGEALVAAFQKAGQSSLALQRLQVEMIVPGLEIEAKVRDYDSHLRATVLGAGGEIPQPPSIDVLHLADKAIARQAPFDQNGNGFRDAVIWEHCLSLADDANPLIFISDDRRAFHAGKGDGEGLAPHLLTELVQLGRVANSVELYSDIEDYLRATGTVDPKSFSAVAEILKNEEAQIAENLVPVLRSADIELRFGSGRVTIEEAHEPSSIHLVDVSAYDDHGLALVTMEVEVDLDLHVEWWDGTAPEEGATTKTVTFTANATYDGQEHVLDDISVGTTSVDIEPDQLTRFRPLYEGPTLWDN